MDAGTWVALALGIGGIGWAGFTYFRGERREAARDEARAQRDRDHELERRWLQEKRPIYAKALAALSTYWNVLREVDLARHGFLPMDDDATTLDRIAAAREPIDAATSELDLMAPANVRKAVKVASSTLMHFGWMVRSPHDDQETKAKQTRLFEESKRDMARALNAMRADLGLGP